MVKLVGCCLVALVLTLGCQERGCGQAKETPRYTAIRVETMHCEGCAKRIGGKLQAVAHVKAIQYDVEKKMLWVHPKEGQVLSPRALWEAVERANDRPLELFTPTGVYTKKPQS